MIWFTSDQHFEHRNVIKFCNRPYAGVDEMTEGLIKNHNSVVGKKDTVYHLGDFTFKRDVEQYLNRMNGKHILILGNHDHGRFRNRLDYGPYDRIEDTLIVKWEGYRFFLSHYAHRVWPNCHRGYIHLYGHSHGNLPGHGKSMDVGVDTNNWMPYSIEEIVALMDKIPNVGVDHHV